MDLSPTDILKSEIIGNISVDQQDAYTKKWEESEENLGRDIFRDLFSHIRTIHKKTKPQDTLLKEFRSHVKASENSVKFIDDVLLPYTAAFDIIKQASYKSSQNAAQVNHPIAWLNQIDNFDWQPSAILYLAKNPQDTAKLTEFFTLLERFAAGMMISRANVNYRLDRYAKILTAIEANANLSVPDSPLNLTTQERSEIVSKLDGDLYQQGKIRQYVLLRLDEALSALGVTHKYSKVTIEHVLPQNPLRNSQWVQNFSDAEREQSTHKLGNLVLLNGSKNSQAQNFDFDLKKRKYFMASGGITTFALTSQVLNEIQWTPQVIARRQNDLLNKLKNVWQL